MGFWILVGIAALLVMTDEILKKKTPGYTEKKTRFLKTIGAIPRSEK